MASRPTVLIAGFGDGLGISLARTFATAGYDVVGVSRSTRHVAAATAAVADSGGAFVHLAVDLTNAEATASAVAALPPVDVLIHTAHALLIRPFVETPSAEFESVWRTSCLTAMTISHAIVPAMIERGRGCVIFTGATASIRGGAQFTAFASAKFALRGFAQALARELAPKGVHVAHVVLDGLLDEPQSTARFGASQSVRMDPDAVASAFLDLARQQTSAWSHEIDLRPFTERF